MPHTNHPPRLEILTNAQRRVKTEEQLRALVILLMDNKLKGKPRTCRTKNNLISGLKYEWLEPVTVEREPLARVTLWGALT
jgi:hypothetical protein